MLQKSKMMPSKETLLGLHVTGFNKQYQGVYFYTHTLLTIVRSFVELVRYLFTIDGVTSCLSQQPCQYPLERFLGCNGSEEEPTITPTVVSSSRTHRH